MDSSSIGLIAALIVLLMASAFFSASETAFSSLSRSRLWDRVDAMGERRVTATLSLADDFDRLLSTILVGNNIVNITAATLGTVLFTKLVHAYGPTVSTVVLTITVLIFGEVGPKTLAKGNAEAVALWVTPLLKTVTQILTPVTALLGLFQNAIGKLYHAEEETEPNITEDQLLNMITTAADQGQLDRNESKLIQSAIEFGDMEVEEILTPRVDIVSVSDQAEESELEEIITSNQFSRIPVWHDSIDNMIGVIHVRDFYQAKREEVPWQNKITDILTTTTSMAIDDLLQLMQTQKTHMAIVVDEFGGTEGLVTLEDILEELVGEIWDEHDEVDDNRIRQQHDGTYVISCRADIDDVFELFHLEQPVDEDDFSSISDWVVECLGHPPKVGDQFTYGNAQVTVAEVKRRRVLQIHVEALPEPEPAEEDE